MILGYCARRSYGSGETVALNVSTDQQRFDVVVAREGLNPEVVLRQADLPGEHQIIPSDVVANGCRWQTSFQFDAHAQWKSGFYSIKLTTDDGEDAEAFFVLRASESKADALWILETNTWNAYNFFGGASTYVGDADGAGNYAGGAPRVSFSRPLPRGFISLPDGAGRLGNGGEPRLDVPYMAWSQDTGIPVWSGAASWGQWGVRFARWVERQGIAIDYAVNSDLEEFPGLLDPYKLMLSVGHDEYWSWEMRDVVEEYISCGGNVVFLSGNTSFWQVRLEQNGDQMVAYKGAVTDDPVVGTERQRRNTGIWSNPMTRRPENQMTGVSFTSGGYARCAGATPASSGGYTIYRPKHWALEGTGLSFGDILGGASVIVAYECDGCDFSFEASLPYPTGKDGTPLNFEIIGIAPVALFSRDNAPEGLYPEGTLTDVEVVAQQMTGSHDAAAVERFTHGHAVMGTYTVEGGGTVFTAGTTDWAYGLEDPQVSRITSNLISRLS